jgi:putrescine---pyruvate transaminase
MEARDADELLLWRVQAHVNRVRSAGASRGNSERAARVSKFLRWRETDSAVTLTLGVSTRKLETRLWHPFAAMGSVRGGEFVVSRGRDVWVYDEAGDRYLDGTASLWYANVGHGRSEIAEAVLRQLRELETYSAFGDMANPPALELAGRLAELVPMAGARVFFGSGGGDGIEAAAKLARLFFELTGQPERDHLIARSGGYHGTHGYGTSLAGIEANRVRQGSGSSATSIVPRDSIEALEAEIDRIGSERVAAFFAEPVIGAGGVHPPPAGYLERAGALCRERGILFIADAVICGFGRLGTWFGIERWGIEPDMIVFAKGVTSGYLPLGGVVVDDRVADPFWNADAPAFRHGVTYAAHATCCAAALANIEILEEEGLLARGRELEPDLLEVLSPLDDHPLVAEVRGGTGLMAAVELDPELCARQAEAPVHVALGAREARVLVRPLGTCVATSPPLTVRREHLPMIADAIRRGLDALAALSPKVAGAARG